MHIFSSYNSHICVSICGNLFWQPERGYMYPLFQKGQSNLPIMLERSLEELHLFSNDMYFFSLSDLERVLYFM